MPVIISDVQNRVKDTVASSPSVGLAVRANGEERTKVIDRNGNVYFAEIPSPTVAPVAANDTTTGTLGNGSYVYRYAYACSKNYPLVSNEISIGGFIYPRGNPSDKSNALIVPATKSAKVTMFYGPADRPDIDEIWIFRTAMYGSNAAGQTEALNAADAGLAYFIKKIPNNPGGGSVDYIDSNGTQGVDQIELDNYPAPTFQFAIYYDPCWFGFGNYTFNQKVKWTAATGSIELVSGKWFDGRNDQYFTLEGVTTGGVDGLGGFRFKHVDATHALAVDKDGTTMVIPGADSLDGSKSITIQGVATTIYKSKPNNPFAWGWTRVIGTLRTAQVWALKVGGGLGTAIAVVPNEPILKVDCEYPAKCYALNLQLMKDYDAFFKSKRIVSDVFSVTSHWSQFTAMTANGIPILWGMDFKNFAIVQSNGLSQVPISTPIPRILRHLTRIRSRQLLAHGIYDPYTELNCMWVTSEGEELDQPLLIDTLIFQHAPSGFWGFATERDVLCSASIPDSVTGEIKTLVGTQTGLYGQAFSPGQNYNWLPPAGLYMGTVSASGASWIEAAEALVSPFNTVDAGVVGNWCLIVDENDEFEQWARISAVTSVRLTFDIIISIGGSLTVFDPTVQPGAKFYIGMIECRLRKFFDMQIPSTDKQFMEMWLTQQGVDTDAVETLLRLYREREETDYVAQIATLQNSYQEGEMSDAWFQKDEIPSELMKSFTLEIINRGYHEWTIYNYILKVQPAP